MKKLDKIQKYDFNEIFSEFKIKSKLNKHKYNGIYLFNDPFEEETLSFANNMSIINIPTRFVDNFENCKLKENHLEKEKLIEFLSKNQKNFSVLERISSKELENFLIKEKLSEYYEEYKEKPLAEKYAKSTRFPDLTIYSILQNKDELNPHWNSRLTKVFLYSIVKKDQVQKQQEKSERYLELEKGVFEFLKKDELKLHLLKDDSFRKEMTKEFPYTLSKEEQNSILEKMWTFKSNTFKLVHYDKPNFEIIFVAVKN
ncbi:MAG: hypothetical protein NUV46_02490 [Nanoarchaeota archaeon]|nr:hypothetical protein [Nanoarchaeota archaeon]